MLSFKFCIGINLLRLFFMLTVAFRNEPIKNCECSSSSSIFIKVRQVEKSDKRKNIHNNISCYIHKQRKSSHPTFYYIKQQKLNIVKKKNSFWYSYCQPQLISSLTFLNLPSMYNINLLCKFYILHKIIKDNMYILFVTGILKKRLTA